MLVHDHEDWKTKQLTPQVSPWGHTCMKKRSSASGFSCSWPLLPDISCDLLISTRCIGAKAVVVCIPLRIQKVTVTIRNTIPLRLSKHSDWFLGILTDAGEPALLSISGAVTSNACSSAGITGRHVIFAHSLALPWILSVTHWAWRYYSPGMPIN